MNHIPGVRLGLALVGALGAGLLLGAGTAQATGEAGGLDLAFGGGDGIAQSYLPDYSTREIAVDSQGRTVVVGFGGSSNTRWYVARFTADGVLDTSFAAGAGYATFFGTFASNRAQGVAIDASDRIIVSGQVTWQVSGGKKPKYESDFGVIRLLTDGTLDTSFGSGGTVLTGFQTTGLSDHAYTALAQPDGKVLAGGNSNTFVALARYTASGALDTTFGNGTGKTMFSVGSGSQRIASLRRDDQGRYVFTTPGPSIAAPSFLVRLLSDGQLDGSFGIRDMTAQLAPFGTGFNAQDLALATDGTMLVFGRINVGGQYDSVVARFTSSGTLDTTFGTGGVRMLGLAGYDEGRGMALQPDGRILLAARWGTPTVPVKTVMVAARLLADGTLDTSYGPGGIGQTAEGTPWSAAIDSSGRFLAGGDAPGNGTMIARWLP